MPSMRMRGMVVIALLFSSIVPGSASLASARYLKGFLYLAVFVLSLQGLWVIKHLPELAWPLYMPQTLICIATGVWLLNIMELVSLTKKPHTSETNTLRKDADFLRGIDQYLKDQLDEAETSLTEAMKQHPQDAAVRIYLARIALLKDQPEKARKLTAWGDLDAEPPTAWAHEIQKIRELS